MSHRHYPRLGNTGRNERWVKKPETAPFCIFPGCACRATHRPWVEVNWFRGDDEQAGPVCKGHILDPVQLLKVTDAWRAQEAAKREAAAKAKAAKRAAGGSTV